MRAWDLPGGSLRAEFAVQIDQVASPPRLVQHTSDADYRFAPGSIVTIDSWLQYIRVAAFAPNSPSRSIRSPARLFITLEPKVE